MSLRFLGTDKDMPFYMMKAGGSIWESLNPFAPSTERGPPSDLLQLHRRALNLTISLSSRAFLTQPSCAVPAGKKPQLLDVKVDVFLNGVRCACTYIPARLPQLNDSSRIVETFRGQRVGFTLEKPWITVPAGQNPDGSLCEYRRLKPNFLANRLTEINNLLLMQPEATDRDGRGRLSVLGEYLNSLAAVELPQELCSGGNARLGVVDVVLTSGLGKKDVPTKGYLTHPTSARLSRLDWNFGVHSQVTSAPNLTKVTVADSRGNVPDPMNMGDAGGFGNTKLQIPTPDVGLSMATRLKRQIPRTSGSSPVGFQCSIPTGQPLLTSSSSPSSIAGSPVSPLEAKRRRTMNSSSSALGFAQTELGSQSNATLPTSLSQQSRQMANAGYVGHTKNGRKDPNIPLPQSSVPDKSLHPKKPVKLVTLKLSPARLRSIPRKETQRGPKGRTPWNGPEVALGGGSLPISQSRIDEDCIVTYDPKGVRQIRKERSWWFKEDGIILGVRYLVVPT